jgi:ribosomal protein S20
MSFSGYNPVEDFLEKLMQGDFVINPENPDTKGLVDALTKYQIDKAASSTDSLSLSASQAHTAITKAMISGAIKPNEGKRGESPEKNQAKPEINTLEELKQEFIKYVQERQQPQPTGKHTTTVSKSMTIVYDIAAKEVDDARNASREKKKLAHQFLGFVKDNRVIIVQVAMEFVRYFLSRK